MATAPSRTEELHKLSPFELKDELIELAEESIKTRAALMLNAGRGNPNWIATTPREAFVHVTQFGLQECRRTWTEPTVGLAGMPHSDGIADRFRSFLDRAPDDPGAHLLRDALAFGIERLGFDADKFVWELCDAAIGDNYPVPDRMLTHAERIVEAYLAKELCDGRPPGRFQLFAVEGGTAAMTYSFHTLVVNGLLHRGDAIALGAPIFSPYLEIPHLDEYSFETVNLEQSEMSSDGYHRWQYPDAELRKLEDPRIKAFFLVNPSNPGSYAIRPESLQLLVEIVKTKRPDLIILTDDVYATFVPGFRSLLAELPRNTIGVYSFSKHFGATGWRLGVVAIAEDNVLDEAIGRLPEELRSKLDRRYGALVLDPSKLKLIDRMVAESRAVALHHTAGLSLPQQLQMTLFALFGLLDQDEVYKVRCRDICHQRMRALFDGLGVALPDDPMRAAYYATLDIEAWGRKNLGPEFQAFLEAHHDPLDIVLALARRRGTVLLNGSGFDAPPWSARVSLANLDDAAYPEIGRNIRDLVQAAIDEWKAAGKPKGGLS